MSTNRPTSTTDQLQQPPPDHELLSIETAAIRLGISPNAVLQRAKRGTLYSEVRGGKRKVWVPDGRSVDPTGGTTTTGRRPDPTILHLSKRLEDLSAAAAIWQERHQVAIERAETAERRADVAERRLVALGQPLMIGEATGEIIAMPASSSMSETEIEAKVETAATPPAAPPAAGRPWFGARLARRIRGD